jgi:hypothetical protein
MGGRPVGSWSIRFIVHLPLGVMTVGLGVESLEDEPLLPKVDYYLDESDPDILVLRRQDGGFAAAFSAQEATKEGNPLTSPVRIQGCKERHRGRLCL